MTSQKYHFFLNEALRYTDTWAYNLKAERPRDLLEHNVLKAEDDTKVLRYYVIISRSLHYKMEMGLIPFFAKK